VQRRVGLFGLAVVVVGALTAAAQSPPASPAPPQGPAKGQVLAAFVAQAVDGTTQDVAFDRPTVLLFFLSGCPTCHKMIPEWNRAFARKPSGLAVYGVLMDQEPPGFFQTMTVAFPVLRAPNRQFLSDAKVYRAPVTVRVGRKGVVEDAVVGLVDPIRLGELFRP
jgi:thiol-disulfide isomerase/thioredoxin